MKKNPVPDIMAASAGDAAAILEIQKKAFESQARIYMKKKKNGYGAMLLVTKLLTVLGVAAISAAFIKMPVYPLSAMPSHVTLAVGAAFLLLAGMNCSVRRKFFTVEG